MGMWTFNKCPRCHGDMFLEKDEFGWYEQCLQCSHTQELPSTYKFNVKLAQREKKPVPAAAKPSSSSR